MGHGQTPKVLGHCRRPPGLRITRSSSTPVSPKTALSPTEETYTPTRSHPFPTKGKRTSTVNLYGHGKSVSGRPNLSPSLYRQHTKRVLSSTVPRVTPGSRNGRSADPTLALGGPASRDLQGQGWRTGVEYSVRGFQSKVSRLEVLVAGPVTESPGKFLVFHFVRGHPRPVEPSLNPDTHHFSVGTRVWTVGLQ